ncbi:MAG: BamA/TamA family outer membrane protein, partial [Saprospiraceae bacterium]|nr:BamA/TamA family outer membrane protein [Saprospiraceae bacterium]
ERPSQAQLGFAYTQRKQVLFYLPFQIFWDKERNQVNGELGYYRYTYLFYGIGNHNSTAAEETYDVNFPRWRINVLRLIKPGHYLGLRYWLDDYRMQRTDPDGQLSGGQLIGSRGGVISGAGLLYNYDNRDDIFYPTRGLLIEVEHFLNRKELGSHFNFVRTSLDAAGYFSTGRKGVLALNVWMTHLTSEVPFQQLAFIGGPRKMRGYFEGIFRDKNLWMLQAEYRRNVYKRAGFVVFAGTGAVSPTIHDLFSTNPHLTYGGGIRFRLSKKEKVNLRLDFAGNERSDFATYLTLKEAF